MYLVSSPDPSLRRGGGAPSLPRTIKESPVASRLEEEDEIEEEEKEESDRQVTSDQNWFAWS